VWWRVGWGVCVVAGGWEGLGVGWRVGGGWGVCVCVDAIMGQPAVQQGWWCGEELLLSGVIHPVYALLLPPLRQPFCTVPTTHNYHPWT
jgi:hypothetical protein